MNGDISPRLGPGMSEVKRPKYLNLFKIRQPVPAWVSILHRISGFALVLATPLLLALFQMSISSPDSYVRYRAVFDYPLTKIVMVGLLWAFFHHLFAGIRYLLLDVHVGDELKTTRVNSTIVLIAGVVCALGVGVLLW